MNLPDFAVKQLQHEQRIGESLGETLVRILNERHALLMDRDSPDAVHSELHCRIIALESELVQWKSNHADVVEKKRNDELIQNGIIKNAKSARQKIRALILNVSIEHTERKRRGALRTSGR